MTAAQVDELLDEATLQDLEFTPPCEWLGIHRQRHEPICAAELVLTMRPPCKCEEPTIRLTCTGCDRWLEENIDYVRCEVCSLHFTWKQAIVDRRPL